MKSFVVLFLLSVCVNYCLGNGKLLLPPPRDGSGSTTPLGSRLSPYPPNDDMTDSCGGSLNDDPNWGLIRAVYQAGSEIMVAWEVTTENAFPLLDYPGIRISIRYNPNDNFSDPENIIAANISAGNMGCNNVNITLDSRTSDRAVLQWMWINPAEQGVYIGCSDIAIQSESVNGSYESVNNTYYQNTCFKHSSSDAIRLCSTHGLLGLLLLAILSYIFL